jgi:diguanylate cyclase (GGDEF)-like protein
MREGSSKTRPPDGTGRPRRVAPLLRPLLQILPETAAILGVLLLGWVGILVSLQRMQTGALQQATRDTGNLARAFEENTARVVGGIEQSLLAIRTAWATAQARGTAFDLADWVRRHQPPDVLVRQIGLVGPDGIVTQSTEHLPATPIGIADRAHFQAQLDPSRDELFISRPIIGRITGRHTVEFTRKLRAADGSFAGIVMLSLGCEDLSAFYQTLQIGHGFVTLAGADGIVRARGPMPPDAAPADLSATPPFRAAEPAGTVRMPGEAGRTLIVSYRRVHAYPLMVLVGFDEQDVLAQYQQARHRLLLGGGAASLAILVLGTVWIDQRRRAAQSRRALRLTLENVAQGIVMLDSQGRIRVANRRAVELLGLPPDLPDVLPDRRRGWPDVLPAPGDGRLRDGRMVEVDSHPIPSGGLVRTYTDVTERRLAEERIRYLAHHDGLTGLPNRLKLSERLARAVAPGGGGFAVLCLDLDDFKSVNDTIGPANGDLVLEELAGRLQLIGRAGDTVARTGGDEFTLLLPGLRDAGAARRVALRVLDRVCAPIDVADHHVVLTGCIGLALHPADGATEDLLLRNAATALQHAKAAGRGSCGRFTPEMETRQRERRELQAALRTALETGGIAVHFQPQFAVDSLEVVGFEALARWRDRRHGVVPPSVFIPLAEESGLIRELGRQVLERACLQAAAWSPRRRIAVNLSPVQFRDEGLPAMLEAVLRRTGLPPGLLELEMTEGVLISDEAQALGALQALRALGVRIALDDFGTGFSSLSYLRRFPFDKLKIDKSFVQAQQHDAGTQAILEAVLGMSGRLNLDVTAEGVETEEQLSMLRRQGCMEVQGFLLGTPMPGEAVQRFLAARAA